MTALNRTVGAGADDGYGFEVSSIDVVYTYNFAGDSSGSENAFFRFTNITIAAGNTITSAIMTVRSGGGGSGAVALSVALENADNPAAPTTYTSLGARTRTSGVAWAPDSAPAGDQNTPNFAAALQTVINRGGWASGNAILVLVDNNSSPAGKDIGWETFETSTVNCGRLAIIYTTPAPPATSPLQHAMRNEREVMGRLT